MRTCPYCQAQLSDDETTCHACGANLGDAPTLPRRGGSRKILWGWILALMIPGAIVVYALIALVANTTGLGPDSAPMRIANTLAFLVGALGLPGLPLGIVLLVLGYSERKKAR